jgi:hypothetical protein
MDVVPKRQRNISALFLIIIVSLIMIVSGSLNGAAAWANIIALPVAIIGVIATLCAPSGERVEPTREDGNLSAASPQRNTNQPAVNQIGFAQRDQINVAHDYIVHGGTDRGER